MANFTTLKNTVKKLEAKQAETDKYQHCGVIYLDEYEQLGDFEVPENERQYGFLLVPRPLSLDEWVEKYGRNS